MRSPREKGKIKFKKVFQELKKGDRVAIARDYSEPANFPKRMQGKSGVIKEKRGKAYIVEIKDFNKLKQYIIKPVHLNKLK